MKRNCSVWHITGVACPGGQWRDNQASIIDISFEIEGNSADIETLAIAKLKEWAITSVGKATLLKAVTLSKADTLSGKKRTYFLRSRGNSKGSYIVNDEALAFLVVK